MALRRSCRVMSMKCHLRKRNSRGLTLQNVSRSWMKIRDGARKASICRTAGLSGSRRFISLNAR